MHILITGAAGMIGRKLTERLVKDGALNGKPIDRLTLIDVVPPEKPAGLFRHGRRPRQRPLRRRAPRPKRFGGKPDVIFHLAGVVSGEAETDFEKGYRVNLDGTRALFEAIRAAGLHAESRLHLVDRRFRRAISRLDSRRISSDAAHLLRNAKSDLRAAARRLHAARFSRRRRHQAADDLRAARQAEQGRVGFFLRHHPRALGRPGGASAGCRERPPYARKPARRGRLSHSCRGPHARAGRAARQSRMPGVSCTVGEQIEALRRVAGDKVAARIRRAPDELVSESSPAGPSESMPSARATLGSRPKPSFDDIIRAHIEDELGGKIAN